MFSIAAYLALLVVVFVVYVGIRHTFIPSPRKPLADLVFLAATFGYTLATHTILAFVLIFAGFAVKHVYYGKKQRP